MIRPDRYAQAVSRKGLKGSGIGVGDYVYVTDLKPVPILKDDPYLQRIYALVIKVNKDTGVHEIPDTRVDEGSNDYKIYLVDPRALELLNEEESNRMRERLTELYETTN